MAQKLTVDYRVYYAKKSGKQVPKIFKLKELNLKPNETVHIHKGQYFVDCIIREHYSGTHKIEIMVNEKFMDMMDLNLNI